MHKRFLSFPPSYIPDRYIRTAKNLQKFIAKQKLWEGHQY